MSAAAGRGGETGGQTLPLETSKKEIFCMDINVRCRGSHPLCGALSRRPSNPLTIRL